MADQKLTIVIDTEGRLQGVEAADASIKKLEKTADDFISSLKLGIGIDIGGQLVRGLESLPGKFQDAVKRGMDFNATLETGRTGIAAILRQFDSAGKYNNFNAALADADRIVSLLQEKSKKSPATFRELLSAFQSTAGAAASANIPLEKHIDLIVLMSQALSSLGIRSEQIMAESRALITGNITQDSRAAKTLGITAPMIEQAKAQGQLYEFLTQKLGGFAEASDAAAKSMDVVVSNLNDTIDQLLGKVTKPIFDGFAQGILQTNSALSEMDTHAFEALGLQIAEAVKMGFDLTRWAIENKDALLFVAKAAMTVGAAYTAIKIKDIVVGLGSKTIAWIQSKLAIDAETAALARNTAAQGANTAGRAAGGSFFKYGGVGMAGAGAALNVGLAAYIVGAEIIKSMEAKNLARIEKENQIGEEIYKQNRAYNEQLSSMSSIQDKEKAREAIEADLNRVGWTIFELQDSTKESDQELVRILKTQYSIRQSQLGNLDQIYNRVSAINQAEEKRAYIAEKTKVNEEHLAKLKEEGKDLTTQISESVYAGLKPGQQLDVSKISLGAVNKEIARLEAARPLNTLPENRQTLENNINKLILERLQLTQEIGSLESKIAKEVESAEEKRKSQMQARMEMIEDYQIKQARLEGKEGIASRLETEKRLRQEIADIVAKTGVTEQQALNFSINSLNQQERLKVKDIISNTPGEQLVKMPRSEFRTQNFTASMFDLSRVLPSLIDRQYSPAAAAASAGKGGTGIGDASNKVSGAVGKAGDDIVLTIDNLGKTITNKFGQINNSIDNLQKQIANNRNN